MSTNYYAIVHLGKVSNQGADKPLLFIQANKLSPLDNLENVQVYAEYILPRHSGMSLEEFREMIDKHDLDIDSMGTVFS